jgi:hypothetical protein
MKRFFFSQGVLDSMREMGAEVYLDFVIFGDIFYHAGPGFLAVKQAPGGRPGKETASRPAKAAEASTAKPSDEDQLSRFLLDDLLK